MSVRLDVAEQCATILITKRIIGSRNDAGCRIEAEAQRKVTGDAEGGSRVIGTGRSDPVGKELANRKGSFARASDNRDSWIRSKS